MQNTYEISNIYMIGDNPKSDIKGANDAKIKSILVKTGIYSKETNDLENPATYFVENFQSAIQLILKLEKVLPEK